MLGRSFVCALVAVSLVLAAASDADAAARKKRYSGRGGKKSAVARQVLGVNDPRYADVILNPVTGEIYHQKNANEQRYPASLTKMMTLYLLFEALAQQKISLNAHLDVSSYAASMPQTNLSLQAGDSIPVEVAIKALVVRSANDVSVVVAEALGGDVENFAQLMTKKARALGMKNTIFKNPNGLPNSGQVTTALDMAKLGIALKRDFPDYYDYFETRQFSWNGVTYYTHNRVMLRYPGTDGIKTGYIGASGFNLVTSVTRGGRPLVGVVMGGASGGWRDNRMIELLDESYQIVAARGAVRGKLHPENLPLWRDAQTGKAAGRGLYMKGLPLPDTVESTPTLSDEQLHTPVDADSAEHVSTSDDTATHPATPSVFEAAPTPHTAVPHPPATETKPAGNFIRYVPLPSQKTQAKAPLAPSPPATPAPAAPTSPVVAAPPSASVGVWGIQVGAFSSADQATRAVNEVYALARKSLSGAQVSIDGPEMGGAPVHRARLVNLSEQQARESCKTLISNSKPCFAFPAH